MSLEYKNPNEDHLPTLIRTLNLYPIEKWVEKTMGKTDDIYGNNLILQEIYKEINERSWLKSSCDFLYCKTEKYRELTKTGKTNEFGYIPIPGLQTGTRIKHPCEGRHPENILTEAPELRSRELAWIIKYRTALAEKTLLFIFTYDPLHAIQLKTLPDSWEACTKYWKTAAFNQGLLRETEKIISLSGFTSLHEWMAHLGPESEIPLSWARHPVKESEKIAASSCNLDIYYSTGNVAYAWTNIEKQINRERARMELQQILCKRVILFDAIYGLSKPIEKAPEKRKLNILSAEETERERNAKHFWDNTIKTAYTIGASDIHLEPIPLQGSHSCEIIVSLRKDGQLNFHTKIPSELATDFIRFSLETSGVIKEEIRRPQDGRRTWTDIETKNSIDLRISCTPAGCSIPKVTMRLLDTNKLKRGIEDLNLEPQELEIWQNALKLNQSLVIVSGPTGSGKSTTLYAALMSIFNRDNKRSFATMEDPVEYRLPFRAVQSPIDKESGITYAKLIEQAMRNDGDTFMIGEVRNFETASAALQLALTGHQVLTSIHANSASETVLRLLELGIDPTILSKTLKLVVAQRLIPTPCPDCKQSIAPEDLKPLLRKLGGELLLEIKDREWTEHYGKSANWVQSEGCPLCNYSGLKGVIAGQEFLVIDKKCETYLKEGNIEKLELAMKEKSLLTMEEVAWKLAWLGKIPIEQAGELTNQLKNG
jgi:type II secretory ATPase GspE/PulE/Tfp pilus assembly ATPase PilB-like protein